MFQFAGYLLSETRYGYSFTKLYGLSLNDNDNNDNNGNDSGRGSDTDTVANGRDNAKSVIPCYPVVKCDLARESIKLYLFGSFK